MHNRQHSQVVNASRLVISENLAALVQTLMFSDYFHISVQNFWFLT